MVIEPLVELKFDKDSHGYRPDFAGHGHTRDATYQRSGTYALDLCRRQIETRCMPATLNVNMLTVVHKDSSGIVMGFPDVCKTPSPAGPIPIPYPNIAMSTDTAQGSKEVNVDGNPVMLKGSVFSMSSGDEAGTAGGGVVSNTTKGKAEFQLYSFDVKFEGKNVCRLTDIMLLNKLSSPNTPPFPEVQPPLVVVPSMMDEEKADEEKAKEADIGLFNCQD